ncbi:hypothetical protein HY498_03805 [Candidatus Woesearchaeota archaeon]|nr:hypothetical protein [Candidatus Woesearchaeota archaeon]
MKKILPSAKQKKRYIVYQIVSGSPLKFDDVKRVINNGLKDFLGTLGLSIANPIIMPFFENNIGILKVSNRYLNEVKLALILIKEINSKKVIFKNIYVSGLLNKAKEFLKGGQQYATN